MNLYELIKKNNFQGFSIPLIRRFAFSILQCLRVLHKDKIIHCDLKPVSIPTDALTKVLAAYNSGL